MNSYGGEIKFLVGMIRNGLSCAEQHVLRRHYYDIIQRHDTLLLLLLLLFFC
jgi:hypothetical protein